jgi:aminoglycoside 3-N-acetyltransferase
MAGLFSARFALKKCLPESALRYLRRLVGDRQRARILSLPPLGERTFRTILHCDLEIEKGDVVLIHSSLDQLHLDFPFYRILHLIREIIGSSGTMLFVTYPKLLSYDFLRRGEIFDVNNTPSYTGILSEFARKQRTARRSLHPTKSVCAIGEYAQELIDSHQLSPFPYDFCSPYHKIMNFNGKVIGLGVSTKFLSFVHCVDDTLKEMFPVNPYHKELFNARCINYREEMEIVRTYAHDMKKMNHNIPSFMSKNISTNICRDMKIQGMNFFVAQTRELFSEMLDLAEKNITIYPSSAYTRGLAR